MLFYKKICWLFLKIEGLDKEEPDNPKEEPVNPKEEPIKDV